MITAVDAAVAEQAGEAAEPIAGPSGLCGQRLDAAPLQEASFADAVEEVCTIYKFCIDCIRSLSWGFWRMRLKFSKLEPAGNLIRYYSIDWCNSC